jgi:hypothetical protein
MQEKLNQIELLLAELKAEILSFRLLIDFELQKRTIETYLAHVDDKNKER